MVFVNILGIEHFPPQFVGNPSLSGRDIEISPSLKNTHFGVKMINSLKHCWDKSRNNFKIDENERVHFNTL
jgi:hypothetical protein